MVLSMENPIAEPIARKRKRESKHESALKPISEAPQRKKSKNKKVKSAPPVLQKEQKVKPCLDHVVNTLETKKKPALPDDVSKKYPVLEDQQLVQKFLSVPMTNNQKGRIRQLLKDSLKGTSEFLLPDVIHTKIQSILKASSNLSETELRKIRILYNMLKTAVASNNSVDQKNKNKKAKKKVSKDGETKTEENVFSKTAKAEEMANKPVVPVKTEQGDVKKVTKSPEKKNVSEKKDSSKIVKPKGPKRYVVFLGNLPPDITKEKIMQHFSEFNECITNIRIPKRAEDKKSSIAYVELKNEPTYELALSKHHSMMGNKRINVLYTTQKNGKITKTEAKSKSAKLIAMQKAGKLIGSIPANRKRSHRRNKMKRAQAKLAAESA